MPTEWNIAKFRRLCSLRIFIYAQQTAVYFSSVRETMVWAAGTFAQCEKGGLHPWRVENEAELILKYIICAEKNFKAALSHFFQYIPRTVRIPDSAGINFQCATHYE